jgi:putative transcriptional regulator
MSDFEHGSSGNEAGYLTGQLLIAMPNMRDPRFEKTVIYMCVHNAEGAMGLVINKQIDSISFPQLLEQLEIDTQDSPPGIHIHFGGPVESGRGFVLHSSEYGQNGTIAVDESIALTATVDILRDMAARQGPARCILALGYAGWGPGQLVSADENLIFGTDVENTWERAVAKIGIDPRLLSVDAGHA